MKLLSDVAGIVMPIILLLFALVFLVSKKNLLSTFTDGVKDGLICVKDLLPTLLLVMCAVNMLFASGALDLLCIVFKPVLSLFGVPEQLLPSVILRPFSGSAVTAVADRMFNEFGADSNISKTACLLMGSTDTIIYTLSIYFSSANIKKTRYALASSFVVFIFSIIFCSLFGKAVFG